jgi:hypothetical protein
VAPVVFFFPPIFFRINNLAKFSKINQICIEKENFPKFSQFLCRKLAEFLQEKKKNAAWWVFEKKIRFKEPSVPGIFKNIKEWPGFMKEPAKTRLFDANIFFFPNFLRTMVINNNRLFDILIPIVSYPLAKYLIFYNHGYQL